MLPIPATDGAAASYPEVLTDVDLRMTTMTESCGAEVRRVGGNLQRRQVKLEVPSCLLVIAPFVVAEGSPCTARISHSEPGSKDALTCTYTDRYPDADRL
jgi:hypothetical protein